MNQETSGNIKIKKNRFLVKIILCILTVCTLLGSMLAAYIQEEKRKEQLFMNQVYSKLRDSIDEIDYILENGYGTSIQRAHYILYDIAEELENGYQFVDDSIPSVASIWFLDNASKINDSFNEQGILTTEGIYFLKQLNVELKELKSNMDDEEKLNLREMSIEDFSIIIKNFYYDE